MLLPSVLLSTFPTLAVAFGRRSRWLRFSAHTFSCAAAANRKRHRYVSLVAEELREPLDTSSLIELLVFHVSCHGLYEVCTVQKALPTSRTAGRWKCDGVDSVLIVLIPSFEPLWDRGPSDESV